MGKRVFLVVYDCWVKLATEVGQDNLDSGLF